MSGWPFFVGVLFQIGNKKTKFPIFPKTSEPVDPSGTNRANNDSNILSFNWYFSERKIIGADATIK